MFMAIGRGSLQRSDVPPCHHARFLQGLPLPRRGQRDARQRRRRPDITKLGGLRKEMPITWVTFLVSTLAITGIVPLSGFFSKDAILHALHTTTLAGYEHMLQLVALVHRPRHGRVHGVLHDARCTC